MTSPEPPPDDAEPPLNGLDGPTCKKPSVLNVNRLSENVAKGLNACVCEEGAPADWAWAVSASALASTNPTATARSLFMKFYLS